ncbi:hypothetical protein [Nocardia kruczakiae]|uniref:hypothetical protein n=1 Tax=Nocardia kruczakiae TaxID=261477 RepID=UPI0012ED778C|nr:hypothetical protein [Nocardia kruczakiae]
MLRLLVTSIIVFLCVVGQAVYTATAVAGPPPCTNYEVGTQYGSIKSEIRPYEGDPIGYYTWWWFIDDLEHRPGKYEWQLFVNGSPITRIQSADKDDMLHFGQPRYASGKYLWFSGDILHVDALHTAPDGTVYVTPLNKCSVP